MRPTDRGAFVCSFHFSDALPPVESLLYTDCYILYSVPFQTLHIMMVVMPLNHHSFYVLYLVLLM